MFCVRNGIYCDVCNHFNKGKTHFNILRSHVISLKLEKTHCISLKTN